MLASALLIAVLPGLTLHGWVVDQQGTPLPGVTISVDGVPARTTTAAGLLEPLPLAVGRHTLTAELEGFETESRLVKVPSAGPLFIRFELRSLVEVSISISDNSARNDLKIGRVEWALDPSERTFLDRTCQAQPASSSRGSLEPGDWREPRRNGWTTSSVHLLRSPLHPDRYSLTIENFGDTANFSVPRKARLDGNCLVLNYPVEFYVGGSEFQAFLIGSLGGQLVLVPSSMIHTFLECREQGCPAFSGYFVLPSHHSDLPPNPSLQRTLPG